MVHDKGPAERQTSCIPTMTHLIPAARALSMALASQV